jgi:hypothetical protein
MPNVHAVTISGLGTIDISLLWIHPLDLQINYYNSKFT